MADELAVVQPQETAFSRALLLGGFTEAERAKILGFLGYPRYYALGPAISFGYPSASEPLYIAEDAFKRISPEARDLVRDDVCKLDALHCALHGAATRQGVENVGTIKYDVRAGRAQLLQEYRRQVAMLADHLGVFPNPMSQSFGGGRREHT